MIKFLCSLTLFLLNSVFIWANTVIKDSEGCNIHDLFTEEHATYLIFYSHHFSDTLFVPFGCNIKFSGGQLSGPICFNKTNLRGVVNLRGSSISGSIKNKEFNADWLCNMDGKTDDAKNINEIIELCGRVVFPKGKYLLKSTFDPGEKIDKNLYRSVAAHIGIHRSNVRLKGENGAEFITASETSSICAYSKPYDFSNSIHDIVIKNLVFTVINNGNVFHQWMHTIKFLGLRKGKVSRCVFNDFHGDAICLDHYGDNPETGERSLNQDISLTNNVITGGESHNNRNGISVISGKNVLIRNNIIRNTSRNDMLGGIVVEPNNMAYTIDNIRIINNHLIDIKGSGGAISVVSIRNGPVYNITISGNSIERSTFGIYCYIKTDHTTERFIIKNNSFDDLTPPFKLYGNGQSSKWSIINNTLIQDTGAVINCDLSISNLVIKNNKKIVFNTK